MMFKRGKKLIKLAKIAILALKNEIFEHKFRE